MDFLRDTGYLYLRLMRATWRMPVFVMISIVQPMLWVLLFGQLFRASAPRATSSSWRRASRS